MRLSCAAEVAVWSLLAVALPVAASRGRGTEADANPVSRVVRLLTEMKEQVEAEAQEDESVYEKMACWCRTNDREKTAAIAEAQKRIGELSATIEEGTATGARLTSEVSGLEEDIQVNQDSIDKATALREKEKEEYTDETKDLTESIAVLKEAVAVLAKVQLLQGQTVPDKVEAALVQVRTLLTSHDARATSGGSLDIPGAGMYKSVMQRDLWDLLSTLPSGVGAGRVITGLEQQPTGYAAGATSYSARSSSILGILKQMQETFQKNLAQSQKAEMQAEIAFQHLRSAKEAEVQASAKSIEEKQAQLAATNQKVAEAKVDLVDTREALSADEKFLMDLKERCATADSEYAERSKTRQEEVQAISEAIQILTEDDARDLFSKTLSLIQTSSAGRRQRSARDFLEQRGNQRLAGRNEQQRARAVLQLLAVARHQKGSAGAWHLATLAVGVQLDGFEKVKEAMDKMIAELKMQQQEEYEKHESCKKDIDENEDATREKSSEKKDVEAKIAGLAGSLEGLKEEIQELNTNVAKAHVALKSAGEQRQAENHDFQQVVADQRATVSILKKALERLRTFYVAKPALLSVRAHHYRQEPGAPVPPPPPTGKAYSKSGTAGGVLQILEKIIQDAQKADQEAVLAEQASQSAYEQLVQNVNVQLETMQKAITEKTIQKERAEADKLLSSEDLRAADEALTNLANQNQALHLSCDYLLTNFALRQQARQEEVEAIQEAKAILSGADFGSEA